MRWELSGRGGRRALQGAEVYAQPFSLTFFPSLTPICDSSDKTHSTRVAVSIFKSAQNAQKCSNAEKGKYTKTNVPCYNRKPAAHPMFTQYSKLTTIASPWPQYLDLSVYQNA